MQYILYNQAAITIMKVTTILCALIDIQHLVDMTGVAAFAFHSRSFGRRILVQGEIDFLCVEIRDLLWKQAMCLVAQHTKGVFLHVHKNTGQFSNAVLLHYVQSRETSDLDPSNIYSQGHCWDM